MSIRHMMEQEYRTALIAGAPSQLARELALWLGERGMQVYVAARNPEELEPYLARARNSGARLVPVELDTWEPPAPSGPSNPSHLFMERKRS